AHPVRDDEDPAVGDHEVVILVPGADDPDIATAGAGYVHADRYATSQWMRSPATPATPAPPNSNITAPAPHPLPFFSGGGAVWGVLSTCVPPPFATPRASSVGSNTSCTSPKRTAAPGASGLSPCTRSPSTNVPFVESRSTSTQTPSRRCSFACEVETEPSAMTRSL